MCYDITLTIKFEEDIKYYLKKKKFRHIIEDVETVTEELKKGNLIGDAISDLGLDIENHTYKVRAVNTDTKSGKSNGYRIIYYVVKDDKEIFLVTIYSKKDDNRVPSNKEIEELIRQYCM